MPTTPAKSGAFSSTSFHGIRMPRRASAPRRPVRSQPRSFDALRLHAGERRLAQDAALEQDVLQLRAVEVELLEAAVGENNALELREARRRQIEPAADEAHVAEGRFRQVGARQADGVQLHAQEGRAGDPPVRPVHIPHDRIRQPGLEVGFLRLFREIRGIRLERWL